MSLGQHGMRSFHCLVLLLIGSHCPQQSLMLVVSEDVDALTHRSDEIHALIGPQFLDLAYFGLNLNSIRLVGACQHVQLLLGLIDASLRSGAIK